jgi:hypothetical protein
MEAVAGAVAVAASGSDFFWMVLTAAMKGLTTAIAAALLLSLIVDLVVLVVSIVHWARDLAILAIPALLVAGAAVYAAFRALGTSAKITVLRTYAIVSVILALIGSAAASADLYLSES